MPPEGPLEAPSLPRVDSRGPYHWSRAQSRLMTARLPERDSGTIRPATEAADQRSDLLICRRIATLAPSRGRTVPSSGAIEWPYRMGNPNLRSWGRTSPNVAALSHVVRTERPERQGTGCSAHRPARPLCQSRPHRRGRRPQGQAGKPPGSRRQTANLAEVVLNLLPIGAGTLTIRPMLRRLVR